MRLHFASDAIILKLQYQMQHPGTARPLMPNQGRLLSNQIRFAEKTVMTEHTVSGFFARGDMRINERQCEELEALIDDDVEWAIYGYDRHVSILRGATRQGRRCSR